MDLQIVNLSKKYEWHRAPRDVEDDDPELAEDEEAPAREIETEGEGERWALRGINAVIKPGEKVGIIGSNGAGKSTLLNILAGITLPSGGYVRGRGLRVLLNSLRTPFRGQLTGRQNLHILAALLGVEAGRLEARIPEILEFSGMENFIDHRVLHYSTQQYRRLTFATALMLDPEIILSDDTLGIGDARYQQRTEQLIAKKVENEGVIFILASNRLSTIRDLCSRVIWLESGKVAADGPAEEVIEAFMDADKGEDDKSIKEVETEAAEWEGTEPSPAAIEDREPAPAERSPAAIEAPGPAPAVLSPVAIEAPEPAPAVLSPVAIEPLEPAPAVPSAVAIEASVISGAAGTLPSEAPLADEQPATVERHDCGEPDIGADREIEGDHRQLVPPADIPIGAEDAPPSPTRVPVSEWSQLARKALDRRSSIERERIEKWMKADRKWLTAEKAFASVPGLGELVDIQLDRDDCSEGGKSGLQVAVRLERPGTEVSVFVDGVFNQMHVFSSELPEQFLVPASGLYFFTVAIDNVLLRPRVVDRPYAKCKLRLKVYLRAPDSDQWKLLSGIVRILLLGEEWEPRVAYPAGLVGPALKPILDWKVEMSLDEVAAMDQSEKPEGNEEAVVNSSSGHTPS